MSGLGELPPPVGGHSSFTREVAISLSRCRFGLLLALVGCGDRQTARTETGPDNGALSATLVGENSLSLHELSRPFRALSSGRGTYFLAARTTDRLIIEIDSATGDVVRTIGGIGEGPGEYRDLGMMLMKGDSLFVQNPISGVMAIYSPDGEYVHSRPFEIAVQAGEAVRLRGDTMLVAEPKQLPETFGLPLHLVGPDGTRIMSFGAEDRTVEPGFFTPQLRTLARATDSSVWVARRDRYELELWNTRGTLEQRLAPTRDWFPQMLKDVVNPTVERPETQLGGISLDAHGHLVVLLLRARTGWAPVQAKGPGDLPAYDPLTAFDPFEAVIEVLDTASGELVASSVFTHLRSSGRFLPNGLLLGYAPTHDDAPALAFWSITHNP